MYVRCGGPVDTSPCPPPQLVNINDNYMSLMSDNGDIREDLRVPENDVGKEIESKFEAGDEFMVSVSRWLASGAWALLGWGGGRRSVLGFRGSDSHVACSAGHRDFCHGGGMCRRHQGRDHQIGSRTLLPRQQAPPTTSLCILIGSVTKASAFTDNLNHSVVISYIIDLNFFSPLVSLFRCCWNVPVQLAVAPLPDH